VKPTRDELEARCARALSDHLVAGDERTLHAAYEFGRAALAEGIGVLDMVLLLRHALKEAAGDDPGALLDERVEPFLMECLSPFEMAHRGAREANEALRRYDERREELLRRMARELHDEAGQLLATVHLALERVRPHLEGKGSAHLEQALSLMRQVEDEIRRIAHELRPTILDDLGLSPALHFLGEGIGQRAGIEVAVSAPEEERLPASIEIALYRASQEALANVARHARASRVQLEVRRLDDHVICRIRDDGHGFDPEQELAPGRRRGLGIAGIRERIAPLGGTLDIDSRPGSGTELVIRIPLEVTHAHTNSDRG
jgi:signal transduction histidine kinase